MNDAYEEAGITLPIHIGVAGPAKLQTLIKFAVACGVGPSLRVLQKRAMDVTKLVLHNLDLLFNQNMKVQVLRFHCSNLCPPQVNKTQ